MSAAPFLLRFTAILPRVAWCTGQPGRWHSGAQPFHGNLKDGSWNSCPCRRRRGGGRKAARMFLSDFQHGPSSLVKPDQGEWVWKPDEPHSQRSYSPITRRHIRSLRWKQYTWKRKTHINREAECTFFWCRSHFHFSVVSDFNPLNLWNYAECQDIFFIFFLFLFLPYSLYRLKVCFSFSYRDAFILMVQNVIFFFPPSLWHSGFKATS